MVGSKSNATSAQTLDMHTAAIWSVSASQDGRFAVTASGDNTAIVWDLRAGASQVLKNHTDKILGCGISGDGARVVTSSWDGTLRFWNAASGKCVHTRRYANVSAVRSYDCWMDVDGSLVIVVLGTPKDRYSKIFVYQWSSDNVVTKFSSHTFPQAIRRLSASPAFDILAFTTLDNSNASRTAHIVDLSTFTESRSIRLANSPSYVADYYAGISAATCAPAVVVADTESLRVLHPNDPEQDVDLELPNAPEYNAPCAINADGTRVVASTGNNSFSIWDVQTRTIIASLAECSKLPYSCAMSADENVILIGRHGGLVNVHCRDDFRAVTAQSSFSPSAMQSAFGTLLNAPGGVASILSEKFLIDNVKAEHIVTAFDLFTGHNIILLAIRLGVLNKNNISEFVGSAWRLERQLYAAARNLDSSQDSMLIDAVLLHAEKLGIIKSGFMHSVNREMTIESRTAFRRMDDDVRILSEQILRVDSNIQLLQGQIKLIHSQMEGLAKNILAGMKSIQSQMSDRFHQINKAVQGLNKRIRNVESNVITLADNLSKLHGYLKRKRKVDNYAFVAKCIFAFIPIVGKFAGSLVDGFGAAWSGMEILTAAGLDIPDNVQDIGLEFAKQRFETDLTNPKSLSYLVSKKSFGLMHENSKKAIIIAVENSSFKTIATLRKGLIELSVTQSLVASPSHFIDIDKMMYGFENSESEKLLKDAAFARAWFTTHATESISLDNAMSELNNAFEKLNFEKLDDSTLEEAIEFAMDDGNDVFISEDQFVDAFVKVWGDAVEIMDITKAREEWTRMFDRVAGSEKHAVLRITMTAWRLIRKIHDDLCESGETMEKTRAVEILRSCAKEDSNTVDRDEFLNAAEKADGRHFRRD